MILEVANLLPVQARTNDNENMTESIFRLTPKCEWTFLHTDSYVFFSHVCGLCVGMIRPGYI